MCPLQPHSIITPALRLTAKIAIPILCPIRIAMATVYRNVKSRGHYIRKPLASNVCSWVTDEQATKRQGPDLDRIESRHLPVFANRRRMDTKSAEE